MSDEVKTAAPGAREEGARQWPTADDLEQIGHIMHNSWQDTKRGRGFHGPLESCRACDARKHSIMGGFHCDKFHADLIPWEDLPEPQKDINRHAFDAVLPFVRESAAAHVTANLEQRVRELEAERDRVQDEAWTAEMNIDGYEQCAAELFGLCCLVLDGSPEAADARKRLQEHVEHVRSCRKGSCATELGDTQRARANAAEQRVKTLEGLLRRAQAQLISLNAFVPDLCTIQILDAIKDVLEKSK